MSRVNIVSCAPTVFLNTTSRFQMVLCVDIRQIRKVRISSVATATLANTGNKKRDNMLIDKIRYRKFDKSQRSTFSYWAWHWLAFNCTAIKIHHWRPRYLFHDIEKPWLKLILRDYKKVQTWHRTHNAHHLEYRKPDKRNWIDMAIDWECSRLTKIACPHDAMGEANNKFMNNEMSFHEYYNFYMACKQLKLTNIKYGTE